MELGAFDCGGLGEASPRVRLHRSQAVHYKQEEVEGTRGPGSRTLFSLTNFFTLSLKFSCSEKLVFYCI